MRQSKLFTKTRREAPSDEVSTNAQLLIRAGFINKEIAGAYDYLPLGLRVLSKIENIIRKEINSIGGQEVFMTTLQDPDIWKKTDRWSDHNVDIWFKSKLKNDTEVGLANTHEEPFSNMVKHFVRSYKDLPFSAYQFQNKFRNETRAKSGIMRTREFIMKDLYSFHKDESDLDMFYEKVSLAYNRIFDLVGIGKYTYKTFASGGVFSKYSHEFQTISNAGEDTIYIDEEKNIAINKEVLNDEVLKDLDIKKSNLVEKKSIEVGNIFKLGTRFSEPLELFFANEQGIKMPVIMGSYGIGPGRVMGTIVETNYDDKGIIWPINVSPFRLHLIRIGDSEEVLNFSDKIYKNLNDKNVEVFYDDRDVRAGEKFTDADLIGIPNQLIISEKSIREGKFELKDRRSGEIKMLNEMELEEIF